MTLPAEQVVSALSAALLGLTFLFGGRIHPLKSFVRDRRALVSFGAGVAAAYLFVGMMPELAEGAAHLESIGALNGQAGIIVYLVALLGFVIFYGLDHMTRPTPATHEGEAAGVAEGRTLGYGLYVWLLTYLMVVENAGSAQATLWYAVAMAWHFLTIDHSLTEKRGVHYDRIDRYLLAACVALGWALGQILELSATAATLALGFVSGALTVNSAIMELSEGPGRRFAPFALGCALYAFLLIGVGILS